MTEINPRDVYEQVLLMRSFQRVLLFAVGFLVVAVVAVLVMQVAKLLLHLRMDAKIRNTLGKVDEVMAAQAKLQAVYEAVSHWQAAQAADVVKQTVERAAERIEAKVDEVKADGGKVPVPVPAHIRQQEG